MGMIYDNHGRISVEGRYESFYVHASYGYRPARSPLVDLRPGQHFVFTEDGTHCQVTAQKITTTEFVQDDERHPEAERPVVDSPSVIPTYEDGSPMDTEYDDGAPLARLWRDHPHPEFLIADLDDLISALVAYKDEIT